MIRINRGDEPQWFADVRQEELTRVRALLNNTKKLTDDDLGKKYQNVKEILAKRQGWKCAFCESKEQLKRSDVEHFRPKLRAVRLPGCTDEHGYWWLTWTWGNLLFSCRNCNQAPAKLDKFPLDSGSLALLPEQAPPGAERPLLLDPAEAEVNGIEHIQFKPSIAHGEMEWIPTSRGGSARGEWTIKVCMLDRADLITLYTDHVKTNIEPEVELIRQAMAEGDLANVWESWEATILRWMSPSQPYVGLTWDALDYFVPLHDRNQWGLDLHLPGRR